MVWTATSARPSIRGYILVRFKPRRHETEYHGRRPLEMTSLLAAIAVATLGAAASGARIGSPGAGQLRLVLPPLANDRKPTPWQSQVLLSRRHGGPWRARRPLRPRAEAPTRPRRHGTGRRSRRRPGWRMSRRPRRSSLWLLRLNGRDRHPAPRSSLGEASVGLGGAPVAHRWRSGTAGVAVGYDRARGREASSARPPRRAGRCRGRPSLRPPRPADRPIGRRP